MAGNNDFAFGSLKIPFTYKAETNSTLSVYSWQIQFRQTPKFRYYSSRIPYCFFRTFHSCHHSIIAQTLSISYGALLGIFWDQSIHAPWPCGYTHISTFPGRSRALVSVTHAARECTAFGNLQSLTRAHDLVLREDGVNVFVLATLRITRGDLRKRESSSSRGWETWWWDA